MRGGSSKKRLIRTAGFNPGGSEFFERWGEVAAEVLLPPALKN
ncbi:unnamed protein product [Tenebrio molitor]|nr:unnamed protein product [Tenebrio molitor]